MQLKRKLCGMGVRSPTVRAKAGLSPRHEPSLTVGLLTLLVEIFFCRQQFRIQNRCSRRAPDRVVTERDEAIIEHVILSNSPDSDAHSVSRITIEPRLWPIKLVANDYRSGGS